MLTFALSSQKSSLVIYVGYIPTVASAWNMVSHVTVTYALAISNFKNYFLVALFCPWKCFMCEWYIVQDLSWR